MIRAFGLIWEDMSMMGLVGNENNYTFSRGDAFFVNIYIFVEIVAMWSVIGVAAYMSICYQHIYAQLFSLIFFICIWAAIVYCIYTSCELLYHRWRLFKYNESTTLSISVAQREFIYKHDDNVVCFTSNDVEQWYWREYTMRTGYPYVEIIDVQLRNGDRVIISSGIGNVLNFFRDKWKDLGLPKGQKSAEPLIVYMKELY